MMSRMTNGIIDNQKPGAMENWAGLYESIQKWNDEKWQQKYPVLKDPLAKQANDTISLAREIRRKISPDDRRFNTPSPELRERMVNSQNKANSGVDGSNVLNINKTGAIQKFKNSDHYELTEEDKQVDRDFEREERNAAWNVNNSPDDERSDSVIAKDLYDSADHLVKIDLIAAENASSNEFFFDAVRSYLDNAIMDDPRFNDVIEQYEEYIIFNGQDATLTVEDHASALKDLIISFIHE